MKEKINLLLDEFNKIEEDEIEKGQCVLLITISSTFDNKLVTLGGLKSELSPQGSLILMRVLADQIKEIADQRLKNMKADFGGI